MEIGRNVSDFVLDELSGFTSCDWRAWDEETFEQLEEEETTPSVFDFDVGGIDSFLLATGDDDQLSSSTAAAVVAEPFYSLSNSFTSSPVETTTTIFSIGSPEPEVIIGNPSNTLTMTFSPKSKPMKKKQTKSKQNEDNKQNHHTTSSSTTMMNRASRKRKNATTIEESAQGTQGGKKAKGSITKKKEKIEEDQLYRKRYNILHGILEAWNTGGIEDMEEIAPNVYHDDVMLISPDYTEGLHGVKAILEHWANLLDAFPDGIMEEYHIVKEDTKGEKIQVSWVFGGTQISPFKGVAPRHEKVCIRGKTFFTFKDDKISSMVLTWNYRETLLTLLGIKDATNENIVLSAHVKK